MTMRLFVRRCRAFALMFAAPLLVLPAMSMAQDEAEPGRITVRLIQVKPDAIAAFEAAVADRIELEQSAGRPFFHVYERIRGNVPAYAVIVPDNLAGNLPPIEVDPDWIDRVRHAVDRTTLLTVEVYPELGIDSGSLEPSGQYMQVRARTVAPRNRQAYRDWHAQQLLPALRQAGLGDLRSGRVIYGGSQDTFVRYTYSDTPGGGPDVAAAIGQQQLDAILAAEAELLASSENLLYEFRPDLSFTAAAAAE